MQEWPKRLLHRASKVTVEFQGYTFVFDGPEFVHCLENSGWLNNRCQFEWREFHCGLPRDHSIHSVSKPRSERQQRHNFVNYTHEIHGL